MFVFFFPVEELVVTSFTVLQFQCMSNLLRHPAKEFYSGCEDWHSCPS